MRLGPRGQFFRGAVLDGYYTSRPCVRSDGTIYFTRCGTMFAARDLSLAEQLAMLPRDEGWFATDVVEGVDCLYVGVTRHRHDAQRLISRAAFSPSRIWCVSICRCDYPRAGSGTGSRPLDSLPGAARSLPKPPKTPSPHLPFSPPPPVDFYKLTKNSLNFRFIALST